MKRFSLDKPRENLLFDKNNNNNNKMRLIITQNYQSMSDWVADYVMNAINNAQPTSSKPFVLGLPTGSTPMGVYKKLVSLYQQKKVSFANVVTFNMDEYLGLPKEHDQSYYYFMHDNFFNHIDIPKENINILNGMAKDVELECQRYEDKIKSYGTIDLFLGGTGVNGHLAFNEPGASPASRTRKVALTESTISANARFFGNDMSKVPTESLTVGVGTVLESKEVLIMMSGENKAQALMQTVEGAVSQFWPITAIQLHAKSIVVCDEAATADLKVKTYNYHKFIEKQ